MELFVVLFDKRTRKHKTFHHQHYLSSPAALLISVTTIKLHLHLFMRGKYDYRRWGAWGNLLAAWYWGRKRQTQLSWCWTLIRASLCYKRGKCSISQQGYRDTRAGVDVEITTIFHTLTPPYHSLSCDCSNEYHRNHLFPLHHQPLTVSFPSSSSIFLS